jgi:putative SOS response-associated peptidase YedK
MQSRETFAAAGIGDSGESEVLVAFSVLILNPNEPIAIISNMMQVILQLKD